MIYSLTTWLERLTLRDGRCVKKFSNLLCLTECGFYGHLEEDAHLYPNLSMKSCLAQLENGHFSKLLKLQNETHTKQQRSLFCCMFVLETMSVVLHGRSHTAHNTSRVPKSKGPRVSRDRGPPQVNRGFLRSGVSKIQRFQGPRDEGFLF